MEALKNLLSKLAKFRQMSRAWRYTLSALATVIVFATTYAMILPAITVDKDTADADPAIVLEEEAAVESIEEVDEAAPETEYEPVSESAQEIAEELIEIQEADTEDVAETLPEEDVSGSNDSELSVETDEMTDEITDEMADETVAEEITDTAESEIAETDQLATEEVPSYIAAAGKLLYKGADYEIAVSYGEDANLPEDAELVVNEIANGGNSEQQAAYDSYYEKSLEALREKEGDNVNISFARYFDISIMYNGEKLEPEADVDVKISYNKRTAPEVTEQAEVQVVHFEDEDADARTLTERKNDVNITTNDEKLNEVTFKTDGFSVYGIIGTGSEDEPWVLTVNMFAPSVDGDHKFTGYEAYSYQDENGNLVGTQYVENNGTIMDPGTPSIRVDGCVFKGWYYGEKNGESITWGDKVDFESTVSLTNNVEKDIYARYDTAYYVTFYDSNESTIVKTKTADLDANGKYTVTINDVTVIPDNSEMAFRGWSYDKKEVAGRTLIEGDSIEVTGNTKLYPVFVNCKVLTFSENQPAGGGASYTPPEVVFEDGVTTRPTDPHRAGYTFGGWFTEGDGDGGVSGEEFVFGNPLPENKTIYAKWIPGDAKYTVIFWKQKITDNKNAADGDKEYDYEESVQRNSTSGAEVSITNADKQKNYHGFHYNSTNSDTDPVEVKADGSTIINVYYDRNLMTVNFYEDEGYYYSNWQLYDSFTGLYGQTLQQNGYTWPDEYRWNSNQYNTGTVLTFLDAFIFDNLSGVSSDGKTLTQYAFDRQTGAQLRFYKQNVDGTWPDYADFTNRIYTQSGNWKFTDKYSGFDVKYYKTSHNNWNNINTWNETSAGKSTDYESELNIRFVRKHFTIDFMNGAKGKIGSESVYYEASLADITTPTPEFPGDPSDKNKYSFVGWFADPECTTYVSFKELTDAEKQRLTEDWGIQSFTTYDQMPANNLVVYAGWYKNWYMVALNPNGGELPHPDGEYQAGAFYVQYGNLIGGSSLMQTTMEDYDLVGWTISTVDGEVVTARDPERQNKRFVTDFSNWTAGTEFWNFDTQVEGPLQLTAMWKYKKAMYIEYDPDGGTLQEEDEKVYPYADQSQARAVAAPVAPAGKVFAGWQIVVREDGTDTPIEGLILPGETFDINAHDQSSKDKDGNLYIQLKAVYTDIDTTVITYHRNFNNADTTIQVVNDVSVNNNIIGDASKPILPENTFTRPGYRFVEWNTKQDGSGKAFAPGETQYAVDLNDGNDLYAIWEKLYFDLEFIKKGEQPNGDITTLAGASFGLYSDSDCRTPVKGKDGNDYAVVTTEADGVVEFLEIPAPSTEGGVYYVKETAQPDAYEANSKIYTVTYKKADNGKYVGVLKDGDTEITEINNTLIKSDLNILKSNAEGNKLTGAVFNLTRNEKEDGSGQWIDIKELGNFEITKTTGYQVKDLPNGLYKLTEVKAPDGYIIMEDPVQFKLSDGNITIIAGIEIAVSTNGTSEKASEIDVTNEPGTVLPNTGGTGTLPYTLGGIAIIIASALMYGFRMRRRERRLN